MSADPIIEVTGLTKVFHMGGVDVPALRGVSLRVYPGEFLAILGPSGSGKSTLFHVIGGLTPPSEGEVRVAGSDLTAMTDADRTKLRKEAVGFVFQRFNLLPTLTAEENISIAQHIAGHDPRGQVFEETIRILGDRAPLAPQTLRPLGRRAAARSDRARHREQPKDTSRRRAHRQLGYSELGDGSLYPQGTESAAGPDHSDDHSQPRSRSRLRQPYGPHA